MMLSTPLGVLLLMQAMPQTRPAAGVDDVTFHRDVAPVIHAECAPCHHSGGAGPFPLVTFDDVQKRARMVAKVVADRYMPPWLPAPTAHEIANPRTLSDAQIGLIQRWVEHGAPEGDPTHAQQPPVFHDDQWSLGRPDLVLQMDEAFDAPPSGVDVLRTFVLPYHVFGFEGQPRVRAIEFRAENPRVIHHASFLIDSTGTAEMLDRAQPGAGYDGMGDIGFNHAGALGAWSPGSGPFVYPPGVSRPIPKSADFIVETHISPTGKAEKVRASVGLYFARDEPTKTATAITLGSHRIDIPAGEQAYRVSEEFTLPVAVEALGCLPHAHFVCQNISLEATAPDGARQVLLRIDDWDFNFLQPLMYAKPVCLAAGTVLRCEFVYDNSEANPQNPHHPPKRVRLGERGHDEMALLFLYLVPESAADLAKLEQAHQKEQIRRMEEGKAFRARQPAPSNE